jgi:undecaprenyl-diphosphatase
MKFIQVVVALLLDWLRGLGPWRALVTGLTAWSLAWFGTHLGQANHSSLDSAWLDAIHSAIPASLGTVLLRVYQLSGKHVTGLLVLAVVIVMVWKRFWPELLCFLVGTGGIVLIVDRWLKPLFNRPRPSGVLLEDISGRSFPSGHAAGSVVFYFLACCLLSAHYPHLRRPLFLVSSIWVALVWLSTLYCRAHWLSDIAAGAAVGYVWLSFCLAGFTVWEQRRRLRL